jgi:hypothetical protein
MGWCLTMTHCSYAAMLAHNIEQPAHITLHVPGSLPDSDCVAAAHRSDLSPLTCHIIKSNTETSKYKQDPPGKLVVLEMKTGWQLVTTKCKSVPGVILQASRQKQGKICGLACMQLVFATSNSQAGCRGGTAMLWGSTSQ